MVADNLTRKLMPKQTQARLLTIHEAPLGRREGSYESREEAMLQTRAKKSCRQGHSFARKQNSRKERGATIQKVRWQC